MFFFSQGNRGLHHNRKLLLETAVDFIQLEIYFFKSHCRGKKLFFNYCIIKFMFSLILQWKLKTLYACSQKTKRLIQSNNMPLYINLWLLELFKIWYKIILNDSLGMGINQWTNHQHPHSAFLTSSKKCRKGETVCTLADPLDPLLSKLAQSDDLDFSSWQLGLNK